MMKNSSQVQIDWNAVLLRLTSRKFLIALVSLIVILLDTFIVGLNVPKDVLLACWSFIALFIGLEGLKDIQTGE